MFKKLLHRTLLAVGFTSWGVSVLAMTLSAYLAVLGKRVLPDEDKSNCWIFSLPKYWEHGGYLLVRSADDVRLFKKIKIPHAIYIKDLPDNLAVEQFVPSRRSRNKWLPWQTVLYKGTVKTTETPH